MKILINIFLFIFLTNSLIAQTKLDKIITDFMTENDLSYDKLQELESIRKEGGVQSKKWKKAYKNWDKQGVTDSIFIEQFILGRKDFRSKSLTTTIGYSKESVLFSLRFLENRKLLSQENVLFVRMVVHHTVNNKEIIDHDIRNVSNFYISNKTNKGNDVDTITEVAQFLKTHNKSFAYDSLSGLVAEVNRYEDQDILAFKEFLKLKGFSNLDKNSIPRLSLRLYKSGQGWSFENFMGMNSSAIHIMGNQVIMFQPFYQDSVIRDVLIADALIERLKMFEIKRLDKSTTGRYVYETSSFQASGVLVMLERRINSQLQNYGFNGNETSILENLLTLAYNDIYFLVDSRYADLTQAVHDLDLRSFELTTNEHKLIDVILDQDAMYSRQQLKKFSPQINFDDVEKFGEFRLAVYLALAKRSLSLSNDWNESSFYQNPLTENSMHAVGIVPRAPEVMLKVKNELHRLDRERYFNLDKLVLITNGKGRFNTYPKVREDLYLEVKKILLSCDRGDYTPSYTRWVLNFNHNKGEEEVKEVPADDLTIRQPREPVYTEESKYYPPAPSPIPPKNVESEIVNFPDVEASFPGGPNSKKSWIEKNLQYPIKSKENGDQARVYVEFVVEVDGSITNVRVMRGGVTKELNREAIRLVRNMPLWTPGEVRGKKVRTMNRMPIVFMLD